MRKIQYNVFEKETKNASGKAKKDVYKILEKNGFKKLYNPLGSQVARVIQQLIGITFLKSTDILFVQYPANIDFCYKYLSKFNNVNKIAIIHDIESLRGEKTVDKEIDILNMFEIIISHNCKMTDYLHDIGLKSKIFNLEIFDYLIDDNLITTKSYEDNVVSFAGNLKKSSFIFKLSEIKGIKFNIYGASFDGINKLNEIDNISYKGSFSSEKIIENIEGGWGLVWDGDSLETCNGITGEYLKYNCPHKVSMCIVSERPVIIWDKAAMSDYIVKNKLGIKISRLSNLKEVIESVTKEEYNLMLENVRKEKKRLVKGKSLESVLKKIL